MSKSILYIWGFWKNISVDGVRIPKFWALRLRNLKVGGKIVPKIRITGKKLWERNSTSNLTFRWPRSSIYHCAPLYESWWLNFARFEYDFFILLLIELKFFSGQVGQENISHREIQHQQPPFTVDSGAQRFKMPIFALWSDFFKNSDPSVARVPATSNPTYFPPNMIETNVMDI